MCVTAQIARHNTVPGQKDKQNYKRSKIVPCLGTNKRSYSLVA